MAANNARFPNYFSLFVTCLKNRHSNLTARQTELQKQTTYLFPKLIKNLLSGVEFEPMPIYVDQNDHMPIKGPLRFYT